MVSKLTIFHKGGALLWTSSSDEDKIGVEPINSLIQNVLLVDRSGQDSYQYNSYTLKWIYENNFDLVFVAVYFSFQKLLYIDEFLETIKTNFIALFNQSLYNSIKNLTTIDYCLFNERYRKILKYYQKEYKYTTKYMKPKEWIQTTKGQQQHQYKIHTHDNKKDKVDNTGNDNNEGENGDIVKGEIEGEREGGSTRENEKENNVLKSTTSSDNVLVKDNKTFNNPYLNKLVKSRSFKDDKTLTPKGKVGKGKGKEKEKIKEKGESKEKKRDWDVWASRSSSKKLSLKDLNEFDMRDSSENQETQEDRVVVLDDATPSGPVDLDESSDSSEDENYDEILLPNDKKTPNNNNNNKNSIWNKFTSLISNKPLTKEDLDSIMMELEKLLTTKNVANSIAKELCESVESRLIGKQIGTFNSVKSTVKQAMVESLERILVSPTPVNILHGIQKAREQNRPYSIVFIGVNGVGKSTNLAKVIYYLKSRNLKVSVAACDTFRSGAIEQLKTHCKALNVRLYDQGYAKDASSVCYAAINKAKELNDDVILIDTAGRMQNNEPLMRSLVSLISKNNPDLILFVGEALVGNDGIDQLVEFNKSLQNLSYFNNINNKNVRLIDGILLTKFDTVDDKVGAAISMTYKSGKPIVFIGTGQCYQDLKRLHSKKLINDLLK